MMIRQSHRVLSACGLNRISVANLSLKFHSEVHNLITSRIVPSNVKFEPPNLLTDRSTERQTNAATVQQELFISNFITSHDEAKYEEWNTLVQNLLDTKGGEIHEICMDYKIMGSCALLKKLDLARSYLAFIKQKRKFDGAIVCEFLKVCYNCKSSLTDQDFRRVKQFTEFLQQKYLVVDFYIGEGIIKGLLLQNKIDESFRIFEKMKQESYVNEDTYSALVLYLLEKVQVDLTKKLLREMIELNYLPDHIFIKWIEVSKGSREQLDEILNTFREFDYRPRRIVCDHLKRAYAKLPDSDKLTGTYGVVSKSGHCSACGNLLEQISLTDKDYANLKDIIINRVLVGQDIFKNTMPYELEKFFRLMDLYAPFDIIIDGLNVAYITEETGVALTYAKVIEKVLKRFAERTNKIMFIGKWHMRKWPGLLDMIRLYGARYFFVEDISTDDPYIIGATLYSGVNARFVTRDRMQKELQHANSEEAALFHRWRRSHQILLKYARSTKEIVVLEPTTYEMVVQPAGNGGWHIPCSDGHMKPATEEIRKWLCLYPAAVK